MKSMSASLITVPVVMVLSLLKERLALKTPTLLYLFQMYNNTIRTQSTTMRTSAKKRSQLRKTKRPFNQRPLFSLIPNSNRSSTKMIHVFKTSACLKSMLRCLVPAVHCIRTMLSSIIYLITPKPHSHITMRTVISMWTSPNITECCLKMGWTWVKLNSIKIIINWITVRKLIKKISTMDLNNSD